MIFETPFNVTFATTMASAFILVLAVVYGLTLGHSKKKFIIAMSLAGVAFVSIVTSLTVNNLVVDPNLNTKFADQLSQEYDGATSSRTYTDMRSSLRENGEASTKFTHNGVDTDVFIKKVYSEDSSKLELKFTVYEAGSLYSPTNSSK